MVKLLYIILLIAASLFYPLYNDNLSYITLITLIILPFIMLSQLIISALFLKCSVPNDTVTVFKGAQGEFCLRLTNNSVFPLSGCKVKVKIVFRPTGAVKYFTAAVPLPALRTETVSVNISPEHCGAADVYLEYVKIYDLIRLFSAKRFRRSKLSGTVCIIPKISESYHDQVQAMLRLPAAESPDSGAESAYGSETPGDVCGFREFTVGDRLSMIHYKLSARFDSDIVKVRSVQNSRRFMLSADFSQAYSDGKYDLELRDRLLEKLMSCAYHLHEENCEVYTAVPEDAPCVTLSTASGAAALYSDNSSYFRIARALAAADFAEAPMTNGYIHVNISDDKDP